LRIPIPQQSKETNRLLSLGSGLGGPVSGRSWLVETCNRTLSFLNRGMYGVVTGRFINFSRSTVPSSSKYQCIRGAGQGMEHSDEVFVSSLMSPSLEGSD
jgi:hypothetical protein